MSYFSKFPQIKYNNADVLDITRRVKLANATRAFNYHPYVVPEGNRPEDVAFEFYGDPKAVWLVLLSTEIIDPYTHWPKSQNDLESFIRKEYATQRDAAVASGYRGNGEDDVLVWTQLTTAAARNILHYKSNRIDTFNTSGVYVSNATYDAMVAAINEQNLIVDAAKAQNVDSEDEAANSAKAKAIDKESKELLALQYALGEWEPVRIYEHEFELNEDRRHIKLFKREYLSNMKLLLEAKLNGK